LFLVFFLLVAVQGEVTIHPCEILLICPAEACHAPIFNRSSTIITLIALIYPAPDSVFSLVSEISGAVVTRLIASIAPADVVALPLALRAEVRQNNRVNLAARTPPVSSRRSVTRVIAARVALVAIVGTENGGTCVATVGASHRP
jgi:hypothetical protein